MMVGRSSPSQRLIFSLSDGERNQMRLWTQTHNQADNEQFLWGAQCFCSVGRVGGRAGWWRVCRGMEDVRGFEVESFILGCAPKALGQQHLFSCCLAVFVVWQSALLCVVSWHVLCVFKCMLFPYANVFKGSLCVYVCVTLHFNFKGRL